MPHLSVLFLDELSEFNRRGLEAFRQPLEERRVAISRALTSTNFVLVAAMNLCPCGFLYEHTKPSKPANLGCFDRPFAAENLLWPCPNSVRGGTG